MKSQRTALIVTALFLLSLNTSVLAGMACFSACAIACCECAGGPAAFAGPLGIAVGVTGCAGICMVACATAAFFPPACFANDTIIAVSSPNGTLFNQPISAIQVNDEVLTLVNGKPVTTRVVRNVQSSGTFEFFDFDLRMDLAVSTLKVTPQHGMLLVDAMGEMRFSLPGHVRVGDKMQSSDGSVWTVSRIGQSIGDKKFTLETTEGSVLASGVLVSTICESEVKVGLKMDDVMVGWKLKHPYGLQTQTWADTYQQVA